MKLAISPACRSALLGIGPVLALSVASAAAAQTQPLPPEYYSLDARGVDLVSGQFNYSTQEVVVGQPGAGGLSYGRVALQMGWRDLAIGGLNCVGDDCLVSVDGVSEAFTRNGTTYSPVSNMGATLVADASGFLFTSSDGRLFRLTSATGINPYSENTALLTEQIEPNGAKTTYTFTSAPFCFLKNPDGSCIVELSADRIQSYSNNFGYQIHYQYVSNSYQDQNPDYYKISNVKGINLAVDFCARTATACTGLTRSWPSVTYTYTTDSTGTNEFATDQGGLQTRYHLDILGQLDAVLPPGRTTEQIAILRSGGMVSTATDASGAWGYFYSDDGSGNRTTTSVGPLGQSIVVESNLLVGRPSSIRDALNGLTRYGYDSQGRLIDVGREFGTLAQFDLDARGNAVQTFFSPRSGFPDPAIVTTATFPATCANPVTCNKPTSTTDGRGNVTDYTFDPVHGGILSVTAPAPTPGAVRPQTRYSYGARYAWYKKSDGVIIQAPTPVLLPVGVSTCATTSSCAGTADEIKTSVAYGMPPGVGDNLLPGSTVTGSGNNALSASMGFTYDPNGDLILVDGPLFGQADTTRYYFDVSRRPTGVVGPDPDEGGALLNRAVKITYNPDSSVDLQEVGTTMGQADNAFATFTSLQQSKTLYDAYVRPVLNRFTAGGTAYSVSQWGYDAAGRTQCIATRMNPAQFASLSGACVAGPLSGFGPDRIAQTSYDVLSRPLEVRSGVGTAAERVETATYDFFGGLETLTDGDGNVSTYSYDGFRRLSQLNYPNANGSGSSEADFESYTYDDNLNIVSTRTRAGQIFGATYDALNRRTAVTAPAGADSVVYTYDNLGRSLSAGIPGGSTINMTWDALNRQTAEAGPLGTMAMQYDPAGRRTRLTWPDAFVVSYRYDPTGAMTQIRQGDDPAPTVLAAYNYDNLGRRTSVTRGNGVGTTYTYDPASRLTALNHDLAGTANDQAYSYGYNPSSQIVSLTSTNDAYAYTTMAAGIDAYAIDGLNRVTQINGAPVLTYDANGNLTSDGTRTWGYDAANRLRSTSTNNGTIAYDALGRLREVTGTLGARYLSDGVEAAGIYPTGGSTTIQARFVRGPWPDELVGSYQGPDATSTLNYQLQDHLGSSVAIAGPTGAIVGTPLAYDDYGQPRAGNGGRFMYTGQLWLPDFGVYHYKARAYNPELGRFLQTDPTGYAAGANLYAYVSNDPVNWTDPMGTCLWRVGWARADDPSKTIVKYTYEYDGVNCPWDRPGGGGGSWTVGDGGGAGASKAQQEQCRLTTRDVNFFRTNGPAAYRTGSAFSVDFSLLLGLSAYESSWGTSNSARLRNNPFGFTPGGDSTVGLSYPSVGAAWSSWGDTYGARVQGVGTNASLFTDRLLIDNRGVPGTDNRGSYNSENPSWSKNVRATIRSVQNRLSKWDGC